MDTPQLLAIIEVQHQDRVRCSAPGCGHSVYKRVHIIRVDGNLVVYGATCFARAFFGQSIRTSHPRFTSRAGRVLSTEERQLLITNAERLVERFEIDAAAEIALKNDPPPRRAKAPPVERFSLQHSRTARERFTPEQRAAVEPEALRILKLKLPGLDFYSAGFNGLLQSEIDRILRDRGHETFGTPRGKGEA